MKENLYSGSRGFLESATQLAEKEKKQYDRHKAVSSSALNTVGAAAEYKIVGSEEAKVNFSKQVKRFIQSIGNLFLEEDSVQEEIENQRSRS